jgi:phosphoribosylaminoimidazolecarboxamide formyltransferase/IMP cyclohydrolase
VLNYDEAIADYMTEQAMEDLGDLSSSKTSDLWVERDEDDDFEDFDDDEDMDADDDDEPELITELRYGENPHQAGQFEGDLSEVFTQLHGKELSYNNLLDLDAALALVADFDIELEKGLACVAIVKHNNACGIALSANTVEAWQMALAADPLSAFGGVVCLNVEVDEALAKEIDGIFFEILVAPGFTEGAYEILKRKKNRILLLLKDYTPQAWVGRAALNGYLFQDNDLALETEEDLKVVTEKEPTDDEVDALIFAARVCKHTKSNAIKLARPGQMIASGMGQTSRVDALNQALAKAARFNFTVAGAVLASDAFFPFPDCVEIAAEAGITAIIQPGGSIKDQDSIDAANQAGIAMVVSGRRHFKH